MAKIVIIGSGIGGLASSCLLSKAGHDVTILEKNDAIGGRAASFEAEGFKFNYGPSWYLLPEVFTDFFKKFDESIKDYLELQKLDPAFRVHFSGSLMPPIAVSGLSSTAKTFENIEPGSGKCLHEYLLKCEKYYKVAMNQFIRRNYRSVFDLMNTSDITGLLKLSPTKTMFKDVTQYFSNQDLRKLMLFCSMFLGTDPLKTPASYGLLNYVLYRQGVFYPRGGFGTVVSAVEAIAKKHGVIIHTNSAVKRIKTSGGLVRGVTTHDDTFLAADLVISNADIDYTDKELLKIKGFHKKKLSPSAVLVHLGIRKKYPELATHTLVMAKDWSKEFKQLKKSRKLPSHPSFYVHNPSLVDTSLAPKDHSAITMLVPTAPQNTGQNFELFVDHLINQFAKTTHLHDFSDNIIYRHIFRGSDFETRYNSPSQSMLGLQHTLKQTGPMRPSNKSRNFPNLYYVGANTVPGIGVPMCLISAELTTERVLQDLKM